MLSNKCILLISPEPWNHVFVSKHHYAIALAERFNDVYFLNPPSGSMILTRTSYANLKLIQYEGFIPGLRFMPSFFQQRVFKRMVDCFERLTGKKFDIIWSFDNSVFYDLSLVSKSTIRICHMVDLNQNFNFEKAAINSDVCLCTTSFIFDKLKKLNAQVFKINHGFFKPNVEASGVLPPGNNRIKAFYAGNLDIKYIDWPLLKKLVEVNPDVDFVFAGTYSTTNQSFEKISGYPNVYYIGVLSSTDLYAFLKIIDIHLVVYRADEFKEQLANPHKTMEYLGSGKMIVATFMAEYVELSENGLIAMTSTNDEYIPLFSKVVEEIDHWNSKNLRDSRIAIAMNNTYQRQLDRIEEIIFKQ